MISNLELAYITLKDAVNNIEQLRNKYYFQLKTLEKLIEDENPGTIDRLEVFSQNIINGGKNNVQFKHIRTYAIYSNSSFCSSLSAV